MGMGSAPMQGYLISWDDLKKLCPLQTSMLEACLEHDESSLDSLALDVYQQNDDEISEEVQKCLDNLFEAFEKVTSVGNSYLSLELSYYDSDAGDRYDNVEGGAIWIVYGMTQLSPAGEKYKEIIQENMWTIYG